MEQRSISPEPGARPSPIQTVDSQSEMEPAAAAPASTPDGAAAAAPATEPNAENKLFVGGCPPSSSEEELRKVFDPHGTVEEIFIMRGGSRSGMACAFVRFQTQQMAKLAIEAIHGQITLENASEPLVVRWADAPGSRKRTNHYGPRRGGGGHGHRDMGRMGAHMSYMQQQQHGQQGGYGYYPMASQHAMPAQMQMQAHAQAMSGGYGVYQQHMGGQYGGGVPMGFMHQQHVQMLNYPQAQMAQWQQQQQQQQQSMSPTGQGQPSPQQLMAQNSMAAQSSRFMAAQSSMQYQQYGFAPAAGQRGAAEGMEAFAGGQGRGSGGKGNRGSPRLGAGAGVPGALPAPSLRPTG